MKLLVMDGPMQGALFPIAATTQVIGRGAEADLTLSFDPQVFPCHCTLSNDGDGNHWIEPIGGAPIRVYGRPNSGRTPIFAGDTFRIGRTRLSLIDDSTDPSEQLAAASARVAHSLGSTSGRFSPADSGPVAIAHETTALSLRQVAAAADERPEVQRVRTRLRVLQEISEAFTGRLDRRDLLETAIERIQRLVRADRVAVWRVTGDATDPDLELEVARTDRRRNDGEPPGRPARRIARRAVQHKSALLVDDAALALTTPRPPVPYRSVLCIPILQNETVAALVHVESREPNSFSREELELVTVVSSQIGSALANADLYGRLRAAYDELGSAHDQLLQSEKLATIGGLTASLAHDLRNILTPVQGVASVVMASDGISNELKTMFDRQMQRLRSLTSQLLSFSSRRPPELQPANLADAIDDALVLVRTEARQGGVEIESTVALPVPPVAADLGRLDQAIVNIMLNAVQAMAATDGGRIRIGIEVTATEVALSVADNGPGIAPAHLESIGKPFFTTKGQKGNGLGIFGCKRIVEQEHGGRLEVSSVVGEGATFTIRLPRPTSALVVDDDEDVRDAVVAMLRGAGLLVQAVADGQAALAFLGRTQPDVIVTDVDMPNLDGWELARAIRQQEDSLGEVVLVFLTSHDDPIDREHGFGLGADVYVAKSETARIADHVATALNQRGIRRAAIPTPVSPDGGDTAGGDTAGGDTDNDSPSHGERPGARPPLHRPGAGAARS